MKTIPVLNNEINTVAPYVATNKARMMIDDAFVNLLLSIQKEFNDMYEIYKIENERTKTIVAKFKETRKKTEAVLRELTQFVNHNIVGYEPTEDDRVNTFSPARKPRSPIDIPTQTPIIDILERRIRQLSLQVSYGIAPDINYRRLPNGVKGTAFFVAFTNLDDPAPDNTDYHFYMNSTKTNTLLQFTDAENGKQVYIKAAFTNAKEQLGPMSSPVNTAVSN